MVRHGGSRTQDGFYWKRGNWEIITVEGEDGRLPGTADTEYLRIPTILFGPLALLFGFSFYIFLPVIGLAMVLIFVAKKIWHGFGRVHTARDVKGAS